MSRHRFALHAHSRTPMHPRSTAASRQFWLPVSVAFCDPAEPPCLHNLWGHRQFIRRLGGEVSASRRLGEATLGCVVAGIACLSSGEGLQRSDQRMSCLLNLATPTRSTSQEEAFSCKQTFGQLLSARRCYFRQQSSCLWKSMNPNGYTTKLSTSRKKLTWEWGAS